MDNIVIVGAILIFRDRGSDNGANSIWQVRHELLGRGGEAPKKRGGAPGGMQHGEGPGAAGRQRGSVARPVPDGGGRLGGSEEDQVASRPLLPLLPAGLMTGSPVG